VHALCGRLAVLLGRSARRFVCWSSRWRLAVMLGKTARRFVCWSSRWRLAVMLGKTARESESLRMRLGGGWRPRLVGA